MKYLIFYTFNYYEKFHSEFIMLNLSLYSIYTEFNNNIFDVIIFTETDDKLKKLINFPCKIIKLEKDNYKVNNNKFQTVEIYNDKNDFLNKFNFIGHVRILLFEELLSNKEYIKYEKIIYMDNDTMIFRGGHDYILKGFENLDNKNIPFTGYKSEISTIKDWYNMLFHDLYLNKGYKLSDRKIHVDNNEYSHFNGKNIVNNGIIIVNNKNEESLKFAQTLIKVYSDLVNIFGHVWGNDQTAFSIVHHMYNLNNICVFNDDNLKYFYHYYSEKHNKKLEYFEYLKNLATFDFNRVHSYFNNFNYTEFDNPKKLFDNVIKLEKKQINNYYYYYYPFMDMIGNNYKSNHEDNLSMNIYGIYKSHDDSIFKKIYSDKHNGIYINYKQIYEKDNIINIDLIPKIIIQIFPSEKHKINNDIKKFCDENNWEYKIIYVDDINPNKIKHSIFKRNYLKKNNNKDKINIYAFYLLYIDGGIYIDYKYDINLDIFNKNILKHNFIMIYNENYLTFNKSFFGSIKENKSILKIMCVDWDNSEYLNNILEKENTWIYPDNLLIYKN